MFWVKEENETVRFEDIKLYTHSLSNALVDIALRGHQMAVTNAHLLANDLSTGGCYPKAWVRKEEGFYLYKAGGQDAVEREVLASKICRCFDCHQVLYEQGMFENEPVSISKIMTSQRYSLVTYAAYDVYCTNHDWNTLDKILELDAYGYYICRRTFPIVCKSCSSPLAERYCACIGINVVSAAASALTVSIPSEGVQSSRI